MRTPVGTVALMLLALAAARAPARDKAVAPDLYAVLVFDTHADLVGPTIQVDKRNLVGILENAFADGKLPGKLYLKVFEGAGVSDKRVRTYIAGLQGKVKPTDTFLFYYCGHG